MQSAPSKSCAVCTRCGKIDYELYEGDACRRWLSPEEIMRLRAKKNPTRGRRKTHSPWKRIDESLWAHSDGQRHIVGGTRDHYDLSVSGVLFREVRGIDFAKTEGAWDGWERFRDDGFPRTRWLKNPTGQGPSPTDARKSAEAAMRRVAPGKETLTKRQASEVTAALGKRFPELSAWMASCPRDVTTKGKYMAELRRYYVEAAKQRSLRPCCCRPNPTSHPMARGTYFVALDNRVRPGLAVATVVGKGAGSWAKREQTIGGASWQVEQPDKAVAVIGDAEGLADKLLREGYLLDFSRYG